MFFEEPKTLIVVYKDEMLLNQLKKLVETNDDTIDSPVGTKDDSVRIVSWTEKVWLAQKRNGTIKNKVLFLGDIKGTDALIPVLDIQFDRYGVRYGWAGDQAVLFTDISALKNHKDYESFLRELNALPVPDIIKSKKFNDANELPTERDIIVGNEPETKPKKELEKKFNLKDKVIIAGDTLEKARTGAVVFVQDITRDRNKLKRQMMFYGIIHFYREHLDTFIKS